jgi:hypothetical protein
MQLDDATEAELEEVVGRLDALVPSEGAHLTIPADAEGRTSAGNRLGYLRLGIEILVAALHPVPASEDAPAQVVPQLGSILSEGSRPPFETCELDESIGSRPPVQSRLGAFGQIGIAVGVVLIVLLAFVGAAVLWRAIFG